MGRSIIYKGYKIQWAKRRESNPEMPASPWKTVPNTGGMNEADTGEMLALLRAQNPDKLYRPWLVGA